ncbi:hypothetical protein [Polaromonas sp.]|uniref:hypothetical protein n=1 Tax=Polaromonas sp. TaxID=1869339 RepID=UPI00352B904E
MAVSPGSTRQAGDVVIHVAMEVIYASDGCPEKDIEVMLNRGMSEFINRGGLTGFDAPMVVEEHSVRVISVPLPADRIDEEQLTDWISRRIENGQLPLEEIPRMMARYALAHPADMRIEFAERMEMEAEDSSPSARITQASDMRLLADGDFYYVEVGFRAPGASVEPLDIWQGLAANKEEAQRKAIAKCWDARLDATDCKPDTRTKKEPRFIASDNWGHIFSGKTESLTRWVIDRSTNTLIDAEVCGFGARWTPLDTANAEDLADSLRDNDVLELDADCGDSKMVGKLPEWVSPRLQISVIPMGSPYPSQAPAAQPAG